MLVCYSLVLIFKITRFRTPTSLVSFLNKLDILFYIRLALCMLESE